MDAIMGQLMTVHEEGSKFAEVFVVVQVLLLMYTGKIYGGN